MWRKLAKSHDWHEVCNVVHRKNIDSRHPVDTRGKSYSDELTLSKWVDEVNVNMTDTKPMTNNNPADEARQLESL